MARYTAITRTIRRHDLSNGKVDVEVTTPTFFYVFDTDNKVTVCYTVHKVQAEMIANALNICVLTEEKI